MADIGEQPGLNFWYVGHSVEPVLKGTKPFREVCKDKAREMRKKEIDKAVVKEAINETQYVYDFWDKPQYLEKFYDNNSQGPVTLTGEYIKWIKTKTAAYLMTEAGKEEWKPWKAKLDEDQKKLQAKNAFTIRSARSSVSTGKNKASENKTLIGSMQSAAVASSLSSSSPGPAPKVSGPGPAPRVSGPGPAPKVSGPGPAPRLSSSGAGPKALSREIKEVFKGSIEIYLGTVAKNEGPGVEFYFVWAPLKDRHALDKLSKLGLVPYRTSNDVLYVDDNDVREKYARDIFAKKNFMSRAWEFVQKKRNYNLADQVQLPDSLAEYKGNVLPVPFVEDRVEFLILMHADFKQTDEAQDIQHFWTRFKTAEHAEKYAEAFKEREQLFDKQQEFRDSFTNLFMTRDEMAERDQKAHAMIQFGLLTDDEYAVLLHDQFTDTMEQCGVVQGEACDRRTMERLLEKFTEIDRDYTSVTIQDYLNRRDKRLDVIKELEKDHRYLKTFEETHEESFAEFFEGFTGLWPKAEKLRDTAVLCQQVSDEAEKKRAEAEQERDRLQQQNDDIMRQLQEAQARLQALGAAGGGAPANDPRPDPAGKPARRKSALKASRVPSRVGSPSPEPERVDLISRPASRAASRAQSPEPKGKRARTPTVRFNPNTPK